MRKRVFKKLFTALLTLSLLLNSASPILRISYAQESTPDAAVTEETSQPAITEQQTDQSTAENSPEQEATVSETPTPENSPAETITPTLSPEPESATDTEVNNLSPPPTDNSIQTLNSLTQETSTTSEESAQLVPAVWQTEDGKATTIKNVVLDQTYTAPQNDKVKIVFTKLPETSDKLSIREIKLSADQQDELSALSDTAYEFTSPMTDGTFEYDLTLPLPQNVNKDEVAVKSAESTDELGNAQTLSETKDVTTDAITIKSLTHFTVFVVVNPSPPPTNQVGNIFDNDNGMPTYVESDTWFASGCTGYDGLTTRYAPNGTGTSIATWTFNVPTTGRYQIYVAWASHSNRGNAVKYTVNSDDVAEPVSINQQSGVASCGWSDFQLLGAVHNFTRGSNYTVVLSNDTAGGNVSADAVKILSVDDPSVVYVDNDWIGTPNATDLGDGKIFGYSAFSTIQAGITGVSSDGTINVAAGTYAENVTINKSLTLMGAGAATVIQVPGASPGIDILAGDVTVRDLQVSSSGDSAPYLIGAAGTIDASDLPLNGLTLLNVIITGPGASATFGTAQGFRAEDITDLTMTNVTISGMRNHAMDILHSSTVAIDNANVTGVDGSGTFGEGGTFAPGPEAIRIEDSNGVSVENSTIDGGFLGINFAYNPGTWDDSGTQGTISSTTIDRTWDAVLLADKAQATVENNTLRTSNTGVLVGFYDTADGETPVSPAVTANISGNTITENARGIRVLDTQSATTNINSNSISGNSEFGVKNFDSDDTLDATNNWWGNASGPLDDKGLPGSPNYNNPLGTGNAVSSYVDYKPWYKDAAMTILSNTAPAVPTLVSPTDGAYVKPAGLILDWSDVTDPSTPITYYYKSSYSSAVGSNNALTSPIYTSGALTTSQIDASGSADHLYYWQVRACDGLGNCSDWSGPWQVTVDSVAPTLTQITPVSNPTNDATPNYIFSSDETGTISYGGDCSSATTTAVTGNNTVTFNALSDGTHSNCTITVTDPAGNPSDPLSVSTFTVDTQAPVSSFSSPVDGSFWNTSIDIQGSSTDVPDTTVDYVRLFYRESVEEDGDFVWIEIDTVENTEGDEPFNWNYSWEPADGEGIYDIMAEATDTAGNTEESPVVEEVTYDVTEPSVTDISISPDPTNHPPSILALATDLLSRIASAIFQVDDEAFSDPIDLPALDGVFDSLSENLFIDEDNTMPYPGEGLHTLYVGAYDFAGNFGYNFASFTVDTTAPTLESTETQDTNGNGKIDAIKLTFSENIDDSLLDSGNPDGWDIIDYDGEAIGTGEGENDSELLLAFDEGESFDTGATPVVTYASSGGGGDPSSTHDAVGNELESYEASADDKALPVLLSAFTRDTDTNGQIDAIELTFSEDIDDDMLDDSEFADGDGWDVDGYSDEVIGTGENENDNILLLTFSESGNSDTGTTPNVSYTSSEDEDTSTHDMVGNELEDGEWFTSDGAPPLIPVADPPAGDYISDQSVTLTSSDDGGTGLEGIYYTTNGDTPDNSSTLHSGAITVDKDMTIKAIAYDNAGNPSDILTAIYGIAPVISEESSSSIGSTTTTITWTTDEPATSRVIYDTVSHATAVSSGDLPFDKYGYANTTDEFDTSPKVTPHSVDLTGLNPETTYYYRTVSRASPEKISDEKSFATTVLLAEDVVPSGGTASTPSCGAVKPSGAPVLLSAVSNANNQVTLTWSKASDPVTYYLITYGTSSGSQTYGNPNVGGKDTTSYAVSGLSGDVTYYFKVRAGNDCMPGDFSNELSVFVPGPFISGPAAGFAPGVLGEATPSAELSPTSSPEKGVLGETPSEVTKGIQRNLALGFGLLVLGSLGLWFIIKLRKRNDENS